jgi:hypothetical protein
MENRPSPRSFRDPLSGVVLDDSHIRRFFRGDAAEAFSAAETQGLLERLEDRELIPAWRTGAGDGTGTRWIEQELVPVISYPYEWTFSMLQQAALAHLEVQGEALRAGMSLVDGSAYNIQFFGTQARFIDLGSLRRIRPGEAWAGYAQFCRHFLNPLLLEALTGVTFNDWLRGDAQGIAPREIASLIGLRHRLRSGIRTHVTLHAIASDLASELEATEPTRRHVDNLTLVRGLRGLIEPLRSKAPGDGWSNYPTDSSYSQHDVDLKREFIANFTAAVQPHRVWDIGANLGQFTLAIQSDAYKIAIERDPATSEALYRAALPRRDVTTLRVDIADPSPSQGWDSRERPALIERARPDLVLMLAVIHHLRFGSGIPLDLIVEWAAAVTNSLIVEWVPRDDPMVHKIAGTRLLTFSDYDTDNFIRLLARNFQQVASGPTLTNGRTLFGARS